MQRSREELEQMNHEELVERVLEMQEMLREGLAVRDSLHLVLNDLLNVKEDEVAYFAEADVSVLSVEDRAIKRAWDLTRHAVSNPLGAARAARKG